MCLWCFLWRGKVHCCHKAEQISWKQRQEDDQLSSVQLRETDDTRHGRAAPTLQFPAPAPASNIHRGRDQWVLTSTGPALFHLTESHLNIDINIDIYINIIEYRTQVTEAGSCPAVERKAKERRVETIDQSANPSVRFINSELIVGFFNKLFCCFKQRSKPRTMMYEQSGKTQGDYITQRSCISINLQLSQRLTAAMLEFKKVYLHSDYL